MYNNVRITGIASGMDIDSIVRDLMRVQRAPLQKLEQDKQLLLWQQEAYREINSLLLNFRNCVFDMRLKSTYNAFTTSSSNEAVVTASAFSSASPASYTFNSVTSLASSASLRTHAEHRISNMGKLDENQSLYTLIEQGGFNNQDFGWIADVSDSIRAETTGKSFVSNISFNEIKMERNTENISVKVNGNTYIAVAGEEDLNDRSVLITSELIHGIEKVKLTFNEEIEEGSKIEIDRHDFEFGIWVYDQNGAEHTETFVINAMNHTFKDVLNTINNNPGSRVSVFYDEPTDKLVLQSRATGNNNTEGNDISVSGGFMENVLGLTQYVSGTDSVFKINGLETLRKNNSFSIDGVNFTIRNTSTAPVTVTANRNIDAAVDTIKDFVQSYNKIIDNIHNKLTEERYRSYRPLTNEQKEAMSEREIELWEEKARSGMLYNDRMLNGILSEMRKILSDMVEGVRPGYNSLYSVGIRTGAYHEKGKLYVNESRLRQALEEDFNEVVKLVTQSSEDINTQQQYKETGIVRRLYDAVSNGMARVTAKSGTASSLIRIDTSFIGRRISEIDNRIETLEVRINIREEGYWRQFTAMEKALSQMYSQSMWLEQQIWFMYK